MIPCLTRQRHPFVPAQAQSGGRDLLTFNQAAINAFDLQSALDFPMDPATFVIGVAIMGVGAYAANSPAITHRAPAPKGTPKGSTTWMQRLQRISLGQTRGQGCMHSVGG